MLTEREKIMLSNIDSDVNIDNLISNLTDEEIKKDFVLLNRFESFNRSKTAVQILMELTDDELKIFKNPHQLYPIPQELKLDDLLSLIDRGVEILKGDFTEKYCYYLSSDKNLLIKYKHLICFETLVTRCKISYFDNIMECYYDEIVNVSTRSILDKLNINTDLFYDGTVTNSNYLLSLLLDRLRQINKRQFKDSEVIKRLLEVIKGYCVENTFNGKNQDIFDYFDEDYICENIEYFNPMQLNDAGKLTEKILQKIIDKPKIWDQYQHGFSDNLIDLSEDFIIANYKKIQNKNILYTQKNIIKVCKKYSENEQSNPINEMVLLQIYLCNTKLSEEELDWIKPKIKNIDTNQFIKDRELSCFSDITLRRLLELRSCE